LLVDDPLQSAEIGIISTVLIMGTIAMLTLFNLFMAWYVSRREKIDILKNHAFWKAVKQKRRKSGPGYYVRYV